MSEKEEGKQAISNENSSWYAYVLPAVILVITAITFGNILGNNFIENLDDNGYVLGNEMIKHLGWANIKEMVSTFYLANYHPLTLLSYALEYKFFGLNPYHYHLDNYALHLLNTLLVYLFIKRFTGKIWVAAITGLFFGIHPMHVESVAWIAERKDLLYTAFFLLSLISYTKYLKEQKKSSLLWAFIWFLASLMSKSAAVCLPLVFLLISYYKDKKLYPKTYISLLPFFALSILFGILAILSQHSTIRDLSPHFGFVDRIFLVSYSTLFYLFRAFVPFDLSVMHYYPVKSGTLPFEYYVALPALLLLIWAVFRTKYFKQELVFGLLFYLITIILVLQILPVGRAIVSERYSYVPYIGVFFMVGEFFTYIQNNLIKISGLIKSTIPYVIGCLALFYSILTYQRNKIWKNGEVLFTDVISKYPNQGDAWYTLGTSMDYQGKGNAAISDYTESLRLDPNYASSYFNRAIIYYKIDSFKNAILDYTQTLRLRPKDTMAYYGRGVAEFDAKQYDSAITDFTNAIELQPKIADYYFKRSNAKYRLKDYSGAIEDNNKGLQYRPDDPNALFNRGLAKYFMSDKDGACKDWTLAAENGNPNAPAALKLYCK